MGEYPTTPKPDREQRTIGAMLEIAERGSFKRNRTVRCGKILRCG